ncbi:MAG: glycosyltransferase [Planctomycetaceae bacterium]
MPIIVAGFPASGTGPVTECLRLCGVRFVHGHGGPPPRCASLPAEPWGWSDGQGGIALPLWLSDHPTARLVACIRHPLEVAVSLNARHRLAFDDGLALWATHADTLLRTTSADGRVIAHYAAFRDDAAEATARLAALLDLAPPSGMFHACRNVWQPGRAPRFTLRDLEAFDIDEGIIRIYRQLCAEAGHADDDAAPRRADAGLIRDLAAAARRLPGSGRDEQPPASVAADAGVALLQAEITRLRLELAVRDDDLRELLDDLRHDFEDDRVSPEKRAYRQTIRGIRELLKERVPEGAVVAIISKGDGELLRQRRCTAWHFPRDPHGGYLGYHPAGDLAAIANLEATRAAGATHLLVPETHAWWLASYPGFRVHLERHARLIEHRPGCGAIYDLAPRRPHAHEASLARLTAPGACPTQVLAWNAPAAAAVLSGAHVFEPPSDVRSLPYIDRSIDVVAVARPSAEQLAEARRVARMAVVDVAAEPVIEWIERPLVAEPPSVSIVMPVHGNWPVTAACLRALLPSLPTSWPIEVVIVDDASPDDTAQRLEAAAAADQRIVVVRNAENLGFVGSCNRGAAVATGEYLVLLNNDTVPLPGWLPPLIDTFRDFPQAGAVGGKLLFPDGRLQEAGGIIFADASACHFGREHPDPSSQPFNHVRPVDYVSGALLATPRSLFLTLGGFDPAFAPGYYEDTDFCFRLRDQGYEVLCQPASTIVHVEGGTAGTDHAVGMKRFQEVNRRRFQARHAAALLRQRPRPASIDRDSWLVLAHRDAAAEQP